MTSSYGIGASLEDAIKVIEELDVDWNEQAARAAERSLSSRQLTRQELIDQLTSRFGGGFTVEEATYAADHVGL